MEKNKATSFGGLDAVDCTKPVAAIRRVKATTFFALTYIFLTTYSSRSVITKEN